MEMCRANLRNGPKHCTVCKPIISQGSQGEVLSALQKCSLVTGTLCPWYLPSEGWQWGFSPGKVLSTIPRWQMVSSSVWFEPSSLFTFISTPLLVNHLRTREPSVPFAGILKGAPLVVVVLPEAEPETWFKNIEFLFCFLEM